ncbi:MAG: hypothetical protein HKN47_12570 [Pirellulaceae bacterium]|nr:hypothetical protein [Pirellulaceae bacterium]
MIAEQEARIDSEPIPVSNAKQKDASAMDGQRTKMMIRQTLLMAALGVTTACPATGRAADLSDSLFAEFEANMIELTSSTGPQQISNLPDPVVIPPIEADELVNSDARNGDSVLQSSTRMVSSKPVNASTTLPVPVVIPPVGEDDVVAKQVQRLLPDAASEPAAEKSKHQFTMLQEPLTDEPALLPAAQGESAPPQPIVQSVADAAEPIEPGPIGDVGSGTAQPRQTPPVERYGEAPVDRTQQFLRTVTPLLPTGKMQIDCGFVYSLLETDFPVLVGANLDRADVRRRALYIPLAMRYGVNDCTQLFLNAPLGWYDNEFATSFGDSSDSELGIGDVSFGITRLLAENTRSGRSLIGTIRATAPTGNASSPLILADPGTGAGVWRLGGDLLIVQNLDPVILFYGAGYTYTFEEEFGGRDVQLGHEATYNLGVGFAANERVTLSTAFRGSYITETEVDGANVPNSDSELMQIRLAATIARCNELVEPFVAFGLTERSPSAQLGIVFTR